MHWNDDAAWAGDDKMIRVRCDYRLVLDNLMDLTRETFVHGASIGQAAVAEAPFVATHGDRTATVTRWMANIDVGVALAGSSVQPEGDKPGNRSQGVNGYVLNTITPETDKTSLYFWAFARNYALHDERLTHELREDVANIFREDELILEAQQQASDEHPGYSFYNLNIDAGSMWMRRLIDKMIAAENGASSRSRVIPLRSAA